MLEKLASCVFWPRFEKQDGRHGHFTVIFRHFCCPYISGGMHGTLSKFSGYVYHAQSFLGYFTGYLYKIKMAAMGVSLIVLLRNPKSVNISKTVRDRAISSKFWTHRVEQECSAEIPKFSNFTILGGHLKFLRKMKNRKYLENRKR